MVIHFSFYPFLLETVVRRDFILASELSSLNYIGAGDCDILAMRDWLCSWLLYMTNDNETILKLACTLPKEVNNISVEKDGRYRLSCLFEGDIIYVIILLKEDNQMKLLPGFPPFLLGCGGVH